MSENDYLSAEQAAAAQARKAVDEADEARHDPAVDAAQRKEAALADARARAKRIGEAAKTRIEAMRGDGEIQKDFIDEVAEAAVAAELQKLPVSERIAAMRAGMEMLEKDDHMAAGMADDSGDDRLQLAFTWRQIEDIMHQLRVLRNMYRHLPGAHEQYKEAAAAWATFAAEASAAGVNDFLD